MKKFVTVFIALVLVSFLSNTTRVEAQSYSKSISANPIGLAFGLFNATFESRIGANNSFTIGGYYFSFATNWKAYGFGGSYRWYFDLNDGKRPLQGLSAGPAILFGFWSYDHPSYDPYGVYSNYDGGTTVAVGGEVAYKWVFGGFVVEPIFTLNFAVASVSGLTYQPYGLGVNLGYAW